MAGDFNSRSTLFWEEDIENREGRIFSNFLLTNNLEELINEPTHVRDDGSQSCLDLICPDQSYIFYRQGVFPPFHTHPKHNIVHANLNLNFSPPPPPHHHHHHHHHLINAKFGITKNAKTGLIQKELLRMNGDDLFFNLNVNKMSFVFTETL